MGSQSVARNVLLVGKIMNELKVSDKTSLHLRVLVLQLEKVTIGRELPDKGLDDR